MSDGTHTLQVNGRATAFPEDAFPRTVAALVTHLSLDPGMVVAEVNGELVRRADFAIAALQPGDRVEVVKFVGGG